MIRQYPLASCIWRRPDGTECLLLRDGRQGGWELRVVRDFEVLERATFPDYEGAQSEAAAWQQRRWIRHTATH